MKYEYICEEHGPFSIECKMEDYKSTAKCPKCLNECSRDYSDYKPAVHLAAGMYGIDGKGGWNS